MHIDIYMYFFTFRLNACIYNKILCEFIYNDSKNSEHSYKLSY